MKTSFQKRLVPLFILAMLWLVVAYLWWDASCWLFETDPRIIPESCRVPTNADVTEVKAADCREVCISTECQAFDAHSRQLYKVGLDPRSGRTSVLCDISELDRLAGERQALLFRYLACHCGWRFTPGYSDRCGAMRRMVSDGFGHVEGLDADYYTDDDNQGWIRSWTCIYFDPEDFGGQRCASGTRLAPEAVTVGDHYNIVIICQGTNLSLHVTERTSFATSRVAQAEFDLSQEEFRKLAAVKEWADMRKLLPAPSLRRGVSTLDVRDDVGGYYLYRAWVNPGERGMIYLRAFEVSQGRELGIGVTARKPGPLERDTHEFCGWSEDPEEKFFVGSRFRLYEHRKSGEPYAARIEVWFRPTNGGPERKLVERVFKIDGGK